MNKEEPFRDQAERLRQKINKVNKDSELKANLPSRSDVHRNKKNKTKWKVKYPVIRILVLFFTLLPITIFSIYSYLGDNKLLTSEKTSGEKNGYEEINIENKQDKEVGKEENSTILEDEETTEENDEKIEKITNKEIEESTIEQKGEDTLPSTDKDQEEVEENNSNTLVYHTVQSNETLFRIAMKYYNSQTGIEIIKKANGISGNEIQKGQVLKIPK